MIGLGVPRAGNMRRGRHQLGLLLLVICLGIAASPAISSPWAEVGDAQLRSDIQLLTAAGVLDDVTTHWPLPWAGVLESLGRPGALDGKPANVRAAAGRILDRAESELGMRQLHSSAEVDVASEPAVVRGYDGLARDPAETQISAEAMFDYTAIRLSVGGELSNWNSGRVKFKPDGSYIAQTIGGAVVYAGYLDHWWGPGWISALSLSNNARPFPQIGIERLSTSQSHSSLFSWLGPWQAEFLLGVLDGPRVDRNTLYNGLRFTFNPMPGLEIGLARTEEFCGEHHPCKPITYYFEFQNDQEHPNHTNDEGVIDLHYSGFLEHEAFELYTQLMNEDSNPIVHSATSHLVGGSIWLPVSDTTARITAEYTDSVPTRDIFSFGDILHGAAYNNYDYIDGMRYRGRTLGFSLDSDSRLASLQISWINDRRWTYTLTFHHASISTPEDTFNIITTAPVTINMGEARVKMALSWATIELAARLQDDQPRPDHGFAASIKSAITFRMW